MLIGIKFTPDFPLFEKLIQAQESDLKQEKDGIGAVLIGQDNKLTKLRDLEDYDGILSQVFAALPNSKIVGLHTRTGTSGFKNLLNVHFFEYAGCLMAHNGWVHGYGTKSWLQNQDKVKENILEGKKLKFSRHNKKHGDFEVEHNLTDVMCDSYQFLANLPRPLAANSLEYKAVMDSFTGVAFIVDKQNKKCFLLTTREIKVHTDFQNYILFYSYDPETTLPEVVEFAGFPIIKDETGVEIPAYELPPGTYEFDYDVAPQMFENPATVLSLPSGGELEDY